MISKNGTEITSLDEWFRLAPPKRPNQWVEGRSAMELARTWLDGLPVEVLQAVQGHPSFGEIHDWTAEPEVALPFDACAGEPRNSDLVVTATDAHGPFLIGVEGKADEEFDKLLPACFVASMEAKLENERSNRLARLEFLTRALFAVKQRGEPSVKLIRYQLLTGCAGVLAEAIRRNIRRAVFLIHEFRTVLTDDAKHRSNGVDLDNFVLRISRSTYRGVTAGQVIGPISLPEHSAFCNGVELYVGKVLKDLR
jgi:hypothetical protein